MANATYPGDSSVTLTPGTEVLGEYLDSGLTRRTGLVRRYDGVVLQLTWLLYLTTAAIDGSRTCSDIAALVTRQAATGDVMSEDDARYLIEEKLQPLGIVAGASEPPPPVPQQMLGLRIRVGLFPAPVVHKLAGLLKHLFHPPLVIVALAGWVAMDAWIVSSGRLRGSVVAVASHPAIILFALGVLTAGTVFHEFGHAAACRYGGARPGRIGGGIYLVWPAMFTDVTDSYRLSRRGRVRTDLGGVYFNVLFALGLFGIWWATHYSPLLVVILLGQTEIVEQLMPLVRLDGYYLLADLVGVPDLFGAVRAAFGKARRAVGHFGELKPVARFALLSWAAVVFPLLGLNIVAAVIYGPAGVRAVVDAEAAQWHALATAASFSEGVLAVISMIFLAIPWLGAAYLLYLVGRLFVRAISRLGRSFHHSGQETADENVPSPVGDGAGEYRGGRHAYHDDGRRRPRQRSDHRDEYRRLRQPERS